jgi:NAD(P)-dependent dehydrogenase (short-subunit alcohol dehydrogenase family)
MSAATASVTSDPFRLDGKTAVVFGTGPGIGASLAHAFADAGANVVVSARSPDAVDELVREISRKHGKVAAGASADVSTPETPSQILEIAERTFGAIDAVIYNAYALDAGHSKTFSYDSTFEASEEDWQRCFEVNVLAPYRIAKAIVPRMSGRGGAFINMLAAAAFTPILPAVAYGSTKSALATMTKYLAKACAPHVRFNAISPSNIENSNRPANMKAAALTFPMARMGKPHEAAAADVYLASPAANFITGQIIYVDGGRITTA